MIEVILCIYRGLGLGISDSEKQEGHRVQKMVTYSVCRNVFIICKLIWPFVDHFITFIFIVVTLPWY